MISIVLIEDNRLVREVIVALLNQQPDLQVVAADSNDDTALLRDVNPQVVLLDVGLWNGDSLRVAEKVTKEFPGSKVIVMDLISVPEDIVEFVNAGVSGFIMKDATLEALVNTIRSVASGVQVLPPRMNPSLYSRIANAAVASGRPEVLESVRMTKREREVMYLIGEGLSNKEIASRLHIAAYTVRSHVRNIMEKLMLHTRLQISAYSHKDAAS